MKKIFLLLAMVSAATFTSCNNDDNRPDNDTISENFEVTVNFVGPDYKVLIPLEPAIYSSDVVLVYRQTGISNGEPVYRLLPQTYFFGDSEIEYVTDFTKNDLTITLDADLDINMSEIQQFTLNQTFRVVIVPGYFSKNVDVNNYDAVMSALNLDSNDVKTIENPIIY